MLITFFLQLEVMKTLHRFIHFYQKFAMFQGSDFDLSFVTQDLSSAERARKAVEAERDELLEEINNSTASKYVA